MAKREQLDVFDFAIRAEKDGISFYTKAAKKFADKDLRELFKKLAQQESEHLRIFSDLKIQANVKGLDLCLKNPDIDDYVESIVQEGLFPKGETMDKRMEKIDGVVDAAVVAMKAETNAILFYTEMVKLAKDREMKKIIEKIIKEEKSHVVMVRNLRADHDPMYAGLAFGRFF